MENCISLCIIEKEQVQYMELTEHKPQTLLSLLSIANHAYANKGSEMGQF